MSTHDFLSMPADRLSADRLAAEGLRYDLVDTSDAAAFGAWLQADMRGFHGGVLDDELLAAWREGLAYRRTTGVWDPTAVDPVSPVGTVNSWPGELTVPGERIVTAWAISSVSVSPTHRRRGIARALLEGELRTAAELGAPMAMLTVSESTIYGRFGFAPAAMAADWRIDTRRARWTGPTASGRLHFVTLEQFRAEVAELYSRVRLASPGQMDVWGLRWDQIAGLRSTDAEARKRLRAVRYVDADGVSRGLALYRLTGNDEDFTKHTLTVHYLLSETADAYAGLWRFLLEVDLVGEVVAPLRSVDEPLRWQLSDWRAASVTATDHLWLRILDVPAALAGRRYATPGRLALDVVDPLGFAAGRWLLTVDGDGFGTVSAIDEVPDDAAALTLSVAELGALYLGGVAATTLADAGRLVEARPGSAAAADAMLRSARAPWLSVWF